MLRLNQINAVNISQKNDFESGVHFHATGTGKSWISLEICLKYIEKYKKNNILWICEQKSILIEQFNKKTIIEKGYKNIFKKFLVLNYSIEKPKNWMQNINSCSFWKKPMLIIINRAFLVSKKKYEKINVNIDLIIHDECHSIINKTTQEFYNFILKKNKNIKCIGFSATPKTTIKPFTKILSYYSIYDAFKDDVIVKPEIVWVKSKKIINYDDILEILKINIKELHYKKIIVWCGMIDLCYELAISWKTHFPNFVIATDTSKNKEKQILSNFDIFKSCEKNSILFCASKHREGSDIKNLDCCLFIDKVEDRNAKTFVQCIGRVLRKDSLNLKTKGVIIDIKAKSCIKICDKINKYLNCDRDIFPWNYNYKKKFINNKQFIINKITLKKIIKPECGKSNVIDETIKEERQIDITDLFVRKIKNTEVYQNRLNYELRTIENKNLTHYLIKAVEILKLSKKIPHVTRGSCGSSLVCYLLGISHVDPVENNIKFERFLNNYRNTLPDIDFDFPHNMRDEIFLQLQLKWPGRVARISNHVHWHEKSATREALRQIGIRKQIPKHEIHSFIKSLPKSKKDKVKQIVKQLDDTFRTYSLHCGGIIFFPDKVPPELILKNEKKNILSQVEFDKRDVSREKIFKIDILSSRGLSQLSQIYNSKITKINKPFDCPETFKLLQNGNNIGITLAESPLMRKALIKIKPKTLDDIALCLAIIRPAAKDARISNGDIDYKTKFIYDDDAISIIANYLNCDYALADKFRRGFSKNDKEILKEFNKWIKNKNIDKKKIYKKLENLRKYSFCKSHALSYAQLVYNLAEAKIKYPKKFWQATIDNCSSYYRKWVHYYEACLNDVNILEYIKSNKDKSIYAENRNKKFLSLTKESQLRNYGYWNMKNKEFFPNCYFYKKNNQYLFSGIFAHTRMLNYNYKNRILSCFVGVSPGKYINIIVKGKFYFKQQYIGIKGRANLTNKDEEVYEPIFFKFY